MTDRGSLGDVLVLFDWNGTLVDDADRARAALNVVLTARGIAPLDAAAFAARFQLPLAAMFADLGVQGGDLAAAEAQWNTAMAVGVAPIGRIGLGIVLGILRDDGAGLGVVSAAGAAAVEADAAFLGVDRVLDHIDAGAADKVEALSRRRAQRPEAVYVGDTEYDIRCAIAAGFVPIGIVSAYCSRERLTAAGAVRVIDELAELVPLVAALARGAAVPG